MTDAVSRRNARLVIATSFFGDLAFMLPIWLLYSTEYLHLSATMSIVLFTGVWFMSGVFEIPTGALADRWGRKPTYMLGSALMLLYPAAYILHAPLYVFFPILVISGFGNSLVSGSLAPLVHRSYEQAGLSKKLYNQFLSRNQSAMFVARALSGVVGAWLFTIKPWLPFLGWLLAIACNIVLCSRMVEDRSERAEGTFRAHIGSTFHAMRRSEIIIAALVGYVLMNLVNEAVWTGYQLFYTQDGRTPVIIGLLFSIIAICSAIAAYFIHRLYARFSPATMMAACSALTTLTAFLIYQPNTTLRLAAILPMAFASGCLAVIVSATIQHIVPNKFQSTALSVYGVLVYVVYTIGSLWIGKVIDGWGTDVGRQAVFVGSFIAFGIVLFLALYTNKTHPFRLDEADDTTAEPTPTQGA